MIQGHLPSVSQGPVRDKPGSRLPCSGDPRPPEASMEAAECLSPLPRLILEQPDRSKRRREAYGSSAGHSWLATATATVEHHTAPSQLMPAALTHLSGRREARKRPIVARRWAAPTPSPVPEPCSTQEPPGTPHGHPGHIPASSPLAAWPPARLSSLLVPGVAPALHPTPLSSPLGTGNSCRQLFNPQ